MKYLVTVVILALVACGSYGCEEHRRQEEARRRAALARAQERAYEDVRDSIYGGDDRTSHYGHSRTYYPSSSSRTLHRSSSSSPTYYRRRITSSSIPSYRPAIPSDSKFCDASQEYYCNVDAECIRDDVTGTWKCRYEQTHTVRRRPVITSGNYRSDRYYPNTRRPIGSSPGSYTSRYPTYVSRTSYKCGSGTKRVNVTARSFRCDDMDECETEKNLCEGTCRNTYGSFYCTCGRGYVRNGTYECSDRDECEDISGICGIATCVNSEGSYECICPDGFEQLGKRSCTDINECKELEPCESYEICYNKWGSYECEIPVECPERYARLDTNDDPNSSCMLLNGTGDYDTPDSISYRKLLVRAGNYPYSYRPIGSMTFTNPNTNFTHHYSVRVVEGAEYFWYQKKIDIYNRNRMTIEFYNRRSLTADEELTFTIMITDRPSRRYGYSRTYDRYGSYYPQPIPPTRRKIVMTVVPQAMEG